MAELVGVFAASHTPVMLNFPDAISEQDRTAVYEEFRKLGAEIAKTRPDAVVVIADDHLHNFFLDNFPAFCIGAAESYQSPAEHWLKIDKHTLAGDTGLGAHLLGEALQAGFDPSRPAVVAWLGVSMYLDRTEVMQTLCFIAAPGLRDGTLARVLTEWETDAPELSILYPRDRHLPARTQATMDAFGGWIRDALQDAALAR